MTDPRVERLAGVLVNYCTNVQPGEWVVKKGGYAVKMASTSTARIGPGHSH